MQPSERGEGRAGTIFWLAVAIALTLATWNVAPIYIANYSFADKLTQAARTPRYGGGDEQVMNLVIRAAQEEKLERFITRQTCRINTMEMRRTIVCEYNRTVTILPGFKHTFRFKNEADQPLI